MTNENFATDTPTDGVNKETSATNAGYASVRYNAVKHGILSELTVLPHENAGEYADLLEALIEEHLPTGMTERSLVEELASVIWRKRRVLMAEGAEINKGLRATLENARDIIPTSAPFQSGLSGDDTDLPTLLSATPNALAATLNYFETALKAGGQAEAILRKGGEGAYEEARLALEKSSRDFFDEHVRDGTYTADPEGLAAYLRETLKPYCHRRIQEARHQPAIKAQIMGEGVLANIGETLPRYEAHLDRKFERTLGMLLKLKELRRPT